MFVSTLVRFALTFGIGLCVMFSEALPVSAETPSVFLEDVTWTELRDAIKSGTTTIIIPSGGTEQNGPLMALGKHNLRVKVLAGKIAEALGNAMVAPVIAYVPEGGVEPPTEHMRFPGTITVSDKTFEQVLESAARSFKLHGFSDIVLIGDHGSYQTDLTAVADKLNREWAKSSVRVHAITQYYHASQGDYDAALLSHGAKLTEIGTHAGLADTSLMLAVEPRLVRTGHLGSETHLGAADGVYGGDPTRSSAELGQLGVNLIVRETVDAIRAATKRN